MFVGSAGSYRYLLCDIYTGYFCLWKPITKHVHFGFVFTWVRSETFAAFIICRFYTYGDVPLENQLEAIEELGLSRFDKLQVDTDIPREPRWKDPVIIQ